MVRNSTTLVPLVGVLMTLITFAVGDLTSVDVQMPRTLDGACCGCDDRARRIQVDLHADSSAELDIDGHRSYVEAPRLVTAIRASMDVDVEAVYQNPDDNTSWQQVVEIISSLANATERKVALVTR